MLVPKYTGSHNSKWYRTPPGYGQKVMTQTFITMLHLYTINRSSKMKFNHLKLRCCGPNVYRKFRHQQLEFDHILACGLAQLYSGASLEKSKEIVHNALYPNLIDPDSFLILEGR